MATISSGGGLTFDFINTSVYNVVQNKEADLQSQIGALGSSPTTGQLLNLQQQIQQWTMLTQIQSTVVQQVGEALKSIIQKSS